MSSVHYDCFVGEGYGCSHSQDGDLNWYGTFSRPAYYEVPLDYTSIFGDGGQVDVSVQQESYPHLWSRWHAPPYGNCLNQPKTRRCRMVMNRDRNQVRMSQGLHFDDISFVPYAIDTAGLWGSLNSSGLYRNLDNRPGESMETMAYGLSQQIPYPCVYIADRFPVLNGLEYVDWHEHMGNRRSTTPATQAVDHATFDEYVVPASSEEAGSDRAPRSRAAPFPISVPQCEPCYRSAGRTTSLEASPYDDEEIIHAEQSNGWSPFTANMTDLRAGLQALRDERTILGYERQFLQQLDRDFRAFYNRIERSRQGTREGWSSWNDTINTAPYQAGHGPVEDRGYVWEQDRETNDSGSAAVAAFQRYNAAWIAILGSRGDSRFIDDSPSSVAANATDKAIPWPTPDLQMSSLSRTTPSLYRNTTMRQNSGHRDLYSNEDHSTIVLPPEIAEDPFQLQKWNAFCFFICAFGLAPYYDDRTGTDFHIIINRFQFDGTRSIADEELIQKLEALKAQLRQEKRRWHPDRLRSAAGFDLNVNDKGERGEAAKAVWGAILEASRACEACLNWVLGRRR